MVLYFNEECADVSSAYVSGYGITLDSRVRAWCEYNSLHLEFYYQFLLSQQYGMCAVRYILFLYVGGGMLRVF